MQKQKMRNSCGDTAQISQGSFDYGSLTPNSKKKFGWLFIFNDAGNNVKNNLYPKGTSSSQTACNEL